MKQRSTVHFRRKRQGRTDYRRRIKLVLGGSVRVVARKSLKNLTCQAVEYRPDGDNVIASASSKELEKRFSWKLSRSNTPAAYIVGMLLGKRMLSKGVKKAVFDIGLNTSTKGSKLYAVLKGIVDAGVDIPHNDKILPSEERILGKHISDSKDPSQYSNYRKSNISIQDIPKMVDDIKNKIGAKDGQKE